VELEIIKGMGTNMSEDDYQHLADTEWELTEDSAKILINQTFGFEASRIRIVLVVKTYRRECHYTKEHQTFTRKPMYCATDFNYVRFDVAGWYYEMVDGQLYQYYC